MEADITALIRVRGRQGSPPRLCIRTARLVGVVGDGTGERTATVMVRQANGVCHEYF